MKKVLDLSDGGLFSSSFDNALEMLEKHCSGYDATQPDTSKVNKAKVIDAVVAFRLERDKIAGPVVQRKIVHQVPSQDGQSEQKEEVKAAANFKVNIVSGRKPVAPTITDKVSSPKSKPDPKIDVDSKKKKVRFTAEVTEEEDDDADQPEDD